MILAYQISLSDQQTNSTLKVELVERLLRDVEKDKDGRGEEEGCQTEGEKCLQIAYLTFFKKTVGSPKI